MKFTWLLLNGSHWVLRLIVMQICPAAVQLIMIYAQNQITHKASPFCWKKKKTQFLIISSRRRRNQLQNVRFGNLHKNRKFQCINLFYVCHYWRFYRHVAASAAPWLPCTTTTTRLKKIVSACLGVLSAQIVWDSMLWISAYAVGSAASTH